MWMKLAKSGFDMDLVDEGLIYSVKENNLNNRPIKTNNRSNSYSVPKSNNSSRSYNSNSKNRSTGNSKGKSRTPRK